MKDLYAGGPIYDYDAGDSPPTVDARSYVSEGHQARSAVGLILAGAATAAAVVLVGSLTAHVAHQLQAVPTPAPAPVTVTLTPAPTTIEAAPPSISSAPPVQQVSADAEFMQLASKVLSCADDPGYLCDRLVISDPAQFIPVGHWACAALTTSTYADVVAATKRAYWRLDSAQDRGLVDAAAHAYCPQYAHA